LATSIVDTSGKFATGINNTKGTGGKICRWPMVHLDLRISPRIFAEILSDPTGAWGKMIHEKTFRKNLVTLSL
jgi:hypothetical protein